VGASGDPGASPKGAQRAEGERRGLPGPQARCPQASPKGAQRAEGERRGRARRGPLRGLRHRLRPLLARPLAALGARLAPPLYLAWMRLVFATSRIDPGNLSELAPLLAAHRGAVALFWHEEALLAPYAWARAGVRAHALVALGDAGDGLARILARCGHAVTRGGASRRGSRRRHHRVRELVAWLREREGGLTAIAVDGTRGPAYHLKPGGLLVAREAERPLVLARVWAGRCLRLRSWDRLAIPLPFGAIHYRLLGPFPVPRELRGASLEPLRQRLERELAGLAARSYREAGQRVPSALTPSRPPSPA
jgi:lysophospholipid acyltransferase (LPLAT)-like uncharacterized protein